MVNSKFSNIVRKITTWTGSIKAIKLANLSILLFLIGGFLFHFSESYQIIWNTFMSAVSYIMLFMIQHTQNEDTKVLHEKIDTIKKQTADKDSSSPTV